MTTIYASTTDQLLVASVLPVLAQNNVETVRLFVDFDSAWDNYPARSAVFTTSRSVKPYEVTISSGFCLVPQEVLAEPCRLHITVKGVSAAGEVKSSTRLTLKVSEGAPSVVISDPTPTVYQQLLARMSAQEAAGTVEGSEVIGIRTGADGKVYPTAGDAVREQVGKVEATVEQARAPLPGVAQAYTRTTPNNLIDKSRLVAGYYVNTTGQMVADASWHVTSPIYVEGMEFVYFSSGVGLTCFYKADGTFVSYVTNGADVKVPPEASYLRASILNDYVGTALITRYKNQGYDDGFAVIGKRGYEVGPISFTVPVNQTKADNTVGAGAMSEKVEDYVGVVCQLWLPTLYTPTGKPVKLLMLCHGAGRGATEWAEHAGYQTLVQKFLDRGYAVFDCNGFRNDALGCSFWGDSRGVEAWEKAYQHVVNNYNVEQTFSIYAFSMGGLTAMNLALRGFPGIKSIAMGSPVLNLRACWDDASVRPVLQQLYGLGDEWEDAKVMGCNPFKHIVTLDGVKYLPKTLPPLKVWYGSTEESYGVDKQYAIDFVKAIQNTGGYAEYREVQGAGHEISYGMNETCANDYLVFTERHSLQLYRE